MAGVIDLTSDDDTPSNTLPIDGNSETESEDEDLRRAIAMSLEDHAVQRKSPPARNSNAPDIVETSQSPGSSFGGLLGLNRKVMDVERVARLKRKREDIDEKVSSTSNSAATAAKSISPPPLRRRRVSSPPSRDAPAKVSHQISHSVFRPNSPTGLTTDGFSFTVPHVLLTSGRSRRTTESLSAISLGDIISPPSSQLKLTSAVLSSFIIDFDWLLPHFRTATTSFVFVLHAHSAQHRQLLQQDFADVPNVRLVMPVCLGGGGSMHSKLMVMFFRDNHQELCRIVVPSANLTPADWGVGGVMENILFVVDLPKRTDVGEHKAEPDSGTRFERDLKKQLKAMGVPNDVLSKLAGFEFSAVKDVAFVHSLSQSRVLGAPPTTTVVKQNSIGSFLGTNQSMISAKTAAAAAQDTANIATSPAEDPARSGLLSLSDTVESFGLSMTPFDASYPPSLDFVTSSLGNLSIPFVRQLYSAVCGTLNASDITVASKTKASKIGTDKDEKFDELIKQNLRIYFPTNKTVCNSKGGPASAGTICFQRRWWEANDLIRHCLHDCVGSRGDGILMHSKILYVRFNQPKLVELKDGRKKMYAGWAYIGSANLSESAWGRMIGETKSNPPKMTIRNWESGVLLPVDLDEIVDSSAGKGLEQSATLVATRGEKTLTDDDMGERADRQVDRVSANSNFRSSGPINKSFSLGTRRHERSPASHENEEKKSNDVHGLCILDDVFKHRVPVPFQYAAPRHVEQGESPWFFTGQE